MNRRDGVARRSREAIWVGTGQAIAAIGSLAGIRLLTSAITPVEYGEFALGLTAATLSQQVVLGPLSGAFLRFFSSAREAGFGEAFWAAARRLLRKASLSLGALFLAVALAIFLAGYPRIAVLTVGAAVFAIVSGAGAALDGIQNAARQRVVVAFHQGSSQWLRYILAVVFVLLLGGGSGAAMWGFAAGAGLVFISQIFFVRRVIPRDSEVGDEEDRKRYQTEILGYAWPISIWGVFTFAQMVSDRWILEYFRSLHEVGLYTVLYQLSYYPILLMSGIVVQLVAPILFSRAGDATDRERLDRAHELNDKLVVMNLVIVAIAVAFAWRWSGLIFDVLVDSRFHAVSQLLPWMIAAAGLFTLGETVSLSLLSERATSIMILPKIATALLAIAGYLYGAAVWGVEGIVTAQLLFAATYGAWMVVLSRRRRNGRRAIIS